MSLREAHYCSSDEPGFRPPIEALKRSIQPKWYRQIHTIGEDLWSRKFMNKPRFLELFATSVASREALDN